MTNPDQALWPIGLLGLAAMLAVLLSVGIPLIVAPDPVKLSDWLGFAGAIVGIAGALLVGRIAVAPVWRQVNIMGAQAALQLYPLLQNDLKQIDADGAFLKKLWEFQRALTQLTAQIEFWDGDGSTLVEALAKELINIRNRIGSFTDDDWVRFHGRLGLSDGHRSERKRLQNLLHRIEDWSFQLSSQQRTPPHKSRAEFVASIADQFPKDVFDFLDKAKAALAINLGLHGGKLTDERARLLEKADKLQRSFDLL